MNSPLPAQAQHADARYEQPVLRPLRPRIWDADAPRPPRTAFATLPDVTRRQHRVALFAGAGATLFAAAGFAALLTLGPREPKVREADVPPAAATLPAPNVEQTGEQPMPEIESAIDPVSIKPIPVRTTKVPPGLDHASETVKAVGAALSTDSPRWGSLVAAAESKAEAIVEDIGVTEAEADPLDTGGAANDALAYQSPDDAPAPGQISAAARDAVAAVEAVAAGKADLDTPDAAITAGIPKPEQAEGKPGRITKSVNLRARPDDDSKVLMVVPSKANVNVLSCKSWCEVDYDGTRGFVYKRFLKS